MDSQGLCEIKYIKEYFHSLYSRYCNFSHPVVLLSELLVTHLMALRSPTSTPTFIYPTNPSPPTVCPFNASPKSRELFIMVQHCR